MATKSKKREITLATLDLFVRAIVAEYPSDPSKPGITLSLTADGYYASVVRYREKWGEGKFVVCSAKAKTIDEVLRALGDEWVARAKAKDRFLAEMGH